MTIFRCEGRRPSAADEADLIGLTSQLSEAVPVMQAALDWVAHKIGSTRAELDAFFEERGIA